MRTTHKHPPLLTLNENDLRADMTMSSSCASHATALRLSPQANLPQSVCSVQSLRINGLVIYGVCKTLESTKSLSCMPSPGLKDAAQASEDAADVVRVPSRVDMRAFTA